MERRNLERASRQTEHKDSRHPGAAPAIWLCRRKRDRPATASVGDGTPVVGGPPIDANAMSRVKLISTEVVGNVSMGRSPHEEAGAWGFSNCFALTSGFHASHG
jgi:hypothetical protein